MSKLNDPIQQLKRSCHLTTQVQSPKTKTHMEWKVKEIHLNPKPGTSPHPQIPPCIDDFDMVETTDTVIESDSPLKKKERIIVRNGKILTKPLDKQKTVGINEATHKKILDKKRESQQLSLEKLIDKVLKQQAEIERLKQENRDLILTNKKLQLQSPLMIPHKNKMHTVTSVTILSQTDRKMNTVASLADMTSCTDLSQRSEDLQIQKLKNEILIKEEELKAKDKQNQHQKNLLYQNINSRLKNKEVQCHNSNQQLKKQKQKIKGLQEKVEEYEDYNKQLNQIIQQSAVRVQQVFLKLNFYKQQENKKFIMLGRVKYLENQNTYNNNQIKKLKLEVETLLKKNEQLGNQNGQLRSEISVYLSNPLHSPHAQIFSLAKQLSNKDVIIEHCEQQLKILRPLKQQKQHLMNSNQKNHLLLQESNQELMKQRLRQMNLKFKNMRI